MDITRIFRIRGWSKLSGFVSGFALIFLLAWTVLPASAIEIEASREISAGTVYPGESFTVTVYIKSDQEIEALVLDEDLTGGWHVSYSENNESVFPGISLFKASTLEWIWIENFSAGEEKKVVYNVTVPLNSQPGNYTISGRVSAYFFPAVSVGGISEVTLTYPPSEVDFSVSPLSGVAPLIVQFIDLSASNPDSWEWDFDGNGSIDSNKRNPVYTYENPGNYTVTLKATNSTYGSNTRAKAGYINVTEKPPIQEEKGENKGENSGSGGSKEESNGSIGSEEGNSGGGGSGGGGGAGSPESTRNIELKEVSNEQVFKGTHTCFTFKGGMNEIVTVEFDPKKNFGKTTAIVEILKNTSSIVKEPAPGTVYRNVNIWIGNSGFSSPENLENAIVTFRVSRAWITEKELSEKTVTLYRYSEGSWKALPTVLTGENESYFYFTAETPGFSPFAISNTEENNQSIGISPARTEENQIPKEEKTSDWEKTSDKENQGVPASDIEKGEKESSPGPGAAIVGAELLILYGVLKKKR